MPGRDSNPGGTSVHGSGVAVAPAQCVQRPASVTNGNEVRSLCRATELRTSSLWKSASLQRPTPPASQALELTGDTIR